MEARLSHSYNEPLLSYRSHTAIVVQRRILCRKLSTYLLESFSLRGVGKSDELSNIRTSEQSTSISYMLLLKYLLILTMLRSFSKIKTISGWMTLIHRREFLVLPLFPGEYFAIRPKTRLLLTCSHGRLVFRIRIDSLHIDQYFRCEILLFYAFTIRLILIAFVFMELPTIDDNGELITNNQSCYVSNPCARCTRTNIVLSVEKR